MDQLTELYEKQLQNDRQFKYNTNNAIPLEARLLDNIHALTEESIELRREMPNRKYWKTTNKVFNEGKAKEEWADCFIFLLIIGTLLGMDDIDMHREVARKQKINLERHKANGI